MREFTLEELINFINGAFNSLKEYKEFARIHKLPVSPDLYFKQRGIEWVGVKTFLGEYTGRSIEENELVKFVQGDSVDVIQNEPKEELPEPPTEITVDSAPEEVSETTEEVEEDEELSEEVLEQVREMENVMNDVKSPKQSSPVVDLPKELPKKITKENIRTLSDLALGVSKSKLKDSFKIVLSSIIKNNSEKIGEVGNYEFYITPRKDIIAYTCYFGLVSSTKESEKKFSFVLHWDSDRNKYIVAIYQDGQLIDESVMKRFVKILESVIIHNLDDGSRLTIFNHKSNEPTDAIMSNSNFMLLI